jgi:rhomboid protease GluP
MDPIVAAHSEDLADYITKALIAKKGYRLGTVPEAKELLNYFSAVLTRADGVTMSIVTIVRADDQFWRGISIMKEMLERIGRDCLVYTGRAGYRKLPVSITVLALSGSGTGAAADYLAPLQSGTLFSKVMISAIALDARSGQIWTDAPLMTRSLRSFVKDLWNKPRLTEAELRPEPHAPLAARRPLAVTYSLLAITIAIFAAEVLLRLGATRGVLEPNIKTLVALGALDKSLVMGQAQWWRLFSAPLLHGGLIHLALNGLALYFAGAVLENVVGRAWFAAIFAVSAVCGAILSLAINPPNLISVGASGGIMGLFAAAFVLSYRYPKASVMRSVLQSGSLRVLIPSMLPLFDGLFGQKVDYAAHLGGAIGGAALAMLLVLLWAKDKTLPPLRIFAWVIAAAASLCSIYAGTEASKGYAAYSLEDSLIPAKDIPADGAAWKAKSEKLVAAYPLDPRSHMYRALDLMDKGDKAGAEREWRIALGDGTMLRHFFKPALEDYIRANLALVLKGSGKENDARDAARPVCGKQGEISGEMIKAGLCP